MRMRNVGKPTSGHSIKSCKLPACGKGSPILDTTNSSLLRQYWQPRFWPVWLGVGVMHAMAALPQAWRLRIGGALGHLSGHFARHRRHVAAVNLRLCFPQLDDKARARLLEANLASTGIGMFETAVCYWAPREEITRLGEVEGVEHLDAAIARGKGVLLVSAHFTHFETTGAMLAQQRPFHQMYRPNRNPLFNELMKRAREWRGASSSIERNNLRGLIRLLRQGRVVWYAPDQDYGADGTVFVPFFGVPARTITATSRIAQMSGAAVVPYYGVRLPNGRYRVRVLPALDNFPSGDDTADAARINTMVEGWVREAPEQYLWVHRRFKGRPAGEPSFY